MKALRIVTGGILALTATSLVYAIGDEISAPVHAQHAAHMHHAQFSAERAAMHNLILGALVAKTGRAPDDIAKMFEEGGPPEVAKQLNLSEDDMHSIVTNAHRTLVERMQAARLITPDQAEKLKAAPLPMHHHGDAERGTPDVQ